MMYSMYAKKIKVGNLGFSPVTPVTPVTLIKKSFLRPRIPKEPIVCVTSFCHQLFFPVTLVSSCIIFIYL